MEEIQHYGREGRVSTRTIQVRSKGVITLPRELRRKYHVAEGDIFTVVELGDGSLLLKPGVSQVSRLGDEVAKIVAADGLSLDDVLQALDQERETYYREHYAQTGPVPG
jgi:AbrB family looped-hinge helix DNA binding protein